MNRRSRGIRPLLVAAVSLGSLVWWAPAAQAKSSPPAGTTCTWGGTPAAPTGTFTINPGTTNTPYAEPAAFYVTGELAGGTACHGTFTYVGQIDAGGTCAVNTFRGRATGIPGVTRFEGVGVTVLGPARLYDKKGNVVGSENAQVATPTNAPHFTDCNTLQGFTGGTFSSVIVLFGK